jgi:hypothetical protein
VTTSTPFQPLAQPSDKAIDQIDSNPEQPQISEENEKKMSSAGSNAGKWEAGRTNDVEE